MRTHMHKSWQFSLRLVNALVAWRVNYSVTDVLCATNQAIQPSDCETIVLSCALFSVYFFRTGKFLWLLSRKRKMTSTLRNNLCHQWFEERRKVTYWFWLEEIFSRNHLTHWSRCMSVRCLIYCPPKKQAINECQFVRRVPCAKMSCLHWEVVRLSGSRRRPWMPWLIHFLTSLSSSNAPFNRKQVKSYTITSPSCHLSRMCST